MPTVKARLEREFAGLAAGRRVIRSNAESGSCSSSASTRSAQEGKPWRGRGMDDVSYSRYGKVQGSGRAKVG